MISDVRTGTLVAHHSMNTVVSPRGAAQNFMFSLTGKDGVYVLQANGDEVFWFDSIPGAASAICESPADYI